MSEPRLQDIGDYNRLSGEKLYIVWTVIIFGLMIGALYSVANAYFVPEDSIYTTDQITKVPSLKPFK